MQIITLYAHRSYHVGTINYISISKIRIYYFLVFRFVYLMIEATNQIKYFGCLSNFQKITQCMFYLLDKCKGTY